MTFFPKMVTEVKRNSKTISGNVIAKLPVVHTVSSFIETLFSDFKGFTFCLSHYVQLFYRNLQTCNSIPIAIK